MIDVHSERPTFTVIGCDGKDTFTALVTTPCGKQFEVRDCRRLGNSIFGKLPNSDEETEFLADGVAIARMAAGSALSRASPSCPAN